MDYNLDEVINRQGTRSVKWEFVKKNDEMVFSDATNPKYGDKRLLPLWVADMDFRCPPAVIEALAARVEHGIFGYTGLVDSYYDAVFNWCKRRYGWDVEKEWMTTTPGIVAALFMLVQAYTEPGDKVLIQNPVYHPFSYAINENGRQIVSNSLLYANGRYTMDFDDLAEKVADPEVKLAILCSPHNPVGRVWTREELTRFGEICIENDVVVVSDEIHCDLILKDQTFTNFATISEKFAQNSIICIAPSKTFNLAGLKTSNIIIPNPELREKFTQALAVNGIHGVNAFGTIALEAAYNHGEAWLEQVLDYIEANYIYLKTYLAAHMPQVAVAPLEGTYLAWCDFNRLGMNHTTLNEIVLERAKVFLNDGAVFGVEGEGFLRVNIACPRSILVEALERIVTAVNRE